MIISDKLKTVLLKDIRPYEKNTKIHTPEQIERIKKSIEDVNYIQPIMLDKDNIIIIGHARYEALKLIDPNMEVEVIDGSKLSSNQVQELRIKDNALNMSEWNFGNLETELNKIYIDFKKKQDEVFKDFGFSGSFLEEISQGSIGEYDEDFNLPEGDKSPFGQVTFILAQKQVDFIQKCLKEIKSQDSNINNYGNKNSNGNAIYRICKEWEKQKK